MSRITPPRKPDEYLVALERQHQAERQAMMRIYRDRREQHDRVNLPVYLRRVQRIQDDAELSEQDKIAAIHAIPRPQEPTLPTHESNFTTAMEIQLSKAKDKAR